MADDSDIPGLEPWRPHSENETALRYMVCYFYTYSKPPKPWLINFGLKYRIGLASCPTNTCYIELFTKLSQCGPTVIIY